MNIEKDVESILVSEEELDRVTTRLAKEITEDYKNSDRKLLILSILKGSLIFTADLIRKISLPMDIDFIKVSSYVSDTTSSSAEVSPVTLPQSRSSSASERLSWRRW